MKRAILSTKPAFHFTNFYKISAIPGAWIPSYHCSFFSLPPWVRAKQAKAQWSNRAVLEGVYDLMAIIQNCACAFQNLSSPALLRVHSFKQQLRPGVSLDPSFSSK